jgi:hypothetical protein
MVMVVLAVPDAQVPMAAITEYVVVRVGDTTMEEVVSPVLQE